MRQKWPVWMLLILIAAAGCAGKPRMGGDARQEPPSTAGAAAAEPDAQNPEGPAAEAPPAAPVSFEPWTERHRESDPMACGSFGHLAGQRTSEEEEAAAAAYYFGRALLLPDPGWQEELRKYGDPALLAELARYDTRLGEHRPQAMTNFVIDYTRPMARGQDTYQVSGIVCIAYPYIAPFKSTVTLDVVETAEGFKVTGLTASPAFYTIPGGEPQEVSLTATAEFVDESTIMVRGRATNLPLGTMVEASGTEAFPIQGAGEVLEDGSFAFEAYYFQPATPGESYPLTIAVNPVYVDPLGHSLWLQTADSGAFQNRFGLSGQYLAGPQAGEGYPGMRRAAVELTVQR